MRDGDGLKVALAVHDAKGKAEPIHAAGAEWGKKLFIGAIGANKNQSTRRARNGARLPAASSSISAASR